jgi:tetratricopeptide (TPR) repeat protein
MSLQQFFSPAISWLSKLLPASLQDIFCNNRGNAEYSLGDYEGVIADCNKAIRFNPFNAIAYIDRGFAKSDLDDHEGAIADYNKAIRLNRNDADTYFHRGVAKSNLEDHEGAIADYNEAIRLNRNDAYTYYNRGKAKSALRDYEGAIADYNEAIRLNPNHVSAYIYRGFAKSDLEDHEGAIADCNEAIRLYNAYWVLAVFWEKRFADSQDTADLAQAISAYRRAIALRSNHQANLLENFADALYRLGVYYIKNGRWYDGLAELQSSLNYYRQTDNSERRADVLAQIARVQLLFGDWERARLFYRDALRLYCHIDHKPGIANCRLALGRMMLSLGYLEDAQHELEIATTLYGELKSPRKSEAEEVLQFVHQFQVKGAKAA